MCMDIAYTVDIDICHHLQEPSETFHLVYPQPYHHSTMSVTVWLANKKNCFTSGKMIIMTKFD